MDPPTEEVNEVEYARCMGELGTGSSVEANDDGDPFVRLGTVVDALANETSRSQSRISRGHKVKGVGPA